jgi:hypothetical protein
MCPQPLEDLQWIQMPVIPGAHLPKNWRHCWQRLSLLSSLKVLLLYRQANARSFQAKPGEGLLIMYSCASPNKDPSKSSPLYGMLGQISKRRKAKHSSNKIAVPW